MSRTTASNLLICVIQLLATEALLITPAIYDRSLARESILAPISLLTLAPAWAVEGGEFGALAAILCIDLVFLSIMVFSIAKNHKVIGAICLFIFNFLGVGFIAAGY